MDDDRFVHLRVHSEYSLSDGILAIDSLLQAVRAMGMSAVALTDQNNLFAAIKFYRAAIELGVKPIVGADVWVRNPDNVKQPFQLLLLCQNVVGYRNLTALISKAYIEGQASGKPLLERAWLSQMSAGLIALSGGSAGDVGKALLTDDMATAERLVKAWQDDFPQRFYLEIQRIGHAGEQSYLAGVKVLAYRLQVPLVATNSACFLAAEDFEAHEARVCIHQGVVLDDANRVKGYTQEQFLRSADQMQVIFSDTPEALINSVEIAKRCNLNLQLGEIYLPDFPVPPGTTVERHLASLAAKGLAQRLATKGAVKPEAQYTQQLQAELSVINNMGFAGYFLIVADFIQWAKQQGIPVGPGRGSGAGSVVAYALAITDIDPLEHDLLFERFLNPERISMPDFDIDFCMDKRDLVIDYVTKKYGRDNVAQIITYGTMTARAVLRDVGRVLGLPYGFIDKLVKMLPFELGMTLDKALAQEEALQARYEAEDDVRTLFELAKKLEGVTRNVGKHAGGIVIAPRKLTEFSPLYCEQDGQGVVTQFDKDDIETVGLVKFDFLGLRTLTIIDWAVQAINVRLTKENKPLVDINLLATDDVQTFALLCQCATTAVFQLESRGMKDLIKRLQPDCFDEITALVALFRPGPLQSGMVDDFIDRKHGRAKVEYPHPALAPILSSTYGVILYQEQVMQIAQVLAGYNLGAADLLRRAMGKKKPEEMAKQRSIFLTGAVAHGVNEEVASYIFDLMEKFAGYGFNKSHSVAYALIAYQTAWLKAHYPAEFMAAVLSSDLDNTDKVIALIDECKAMQLVLLPPHVNRSDYRFTVTVKGEICYGLGAIKGVGEAAVEEIVQQRMQQGEFTDLFELCHHVDLRKVNRRALEALARAGALDNLGASRASIFASIGSAIQLAERIAENQAVGMIDLFATDAAPLSQAQKIFIETQPWTEEELLAAERESLGLYFSGHPLDQYRTELANIVSYKIAQLSLAKAQAVTLAGLVVTMRTMQTKRGERMAFLTLDDGSGQVELALFPEVYTQHRAILEKGQLLVVQGEISLDDYSGRYRLSCQDILTLEAARQHYARYLQICLDAQRVSQNSLVQLGQVLAAYPGQLPVCLQYRQSNAVGELTLGEKWWVNPSQALFRELGRLAECEKCECVYPAR